ARHPIHTTLTVVTYDRVRGTVTLSIRAFADDFSAAVAAAAHKPVPRDSSVTDNDIALYVRNAFRINLPAFQSCGVQRSADAYIVCLRAPLASSAAEVRGCNLMLTELHPDQVNVVQIDDGRSRTTRLFTRTSTDVRLFSPQSR
ncbi:MAG TPA: DUF6702 family protein, partial [Gemmatimonadaceae bacterium]|nr:DUF6702 family protein [Gemmatimonadaceae bacterium]